MTRSFRQQGSLEHKADNNGAGNQNGHKEHHTGVRMQHVHRRPPLGGYKPERYYVSEGEWVRGDPSPLGLICFGMTTCMLMFINTKWTESALLPTVVFYALAFGGSGQLLAGLLDLIKGNTFGGTVFSSYGCFWLGFGMLVYNETLNGDSFGKSSASGLELFYGLWALLTLIFFITSLRKTASIQVVLSTLVITFILLAAGVQNKACNQAAGYFGVFCAGSALYAAAIILIKNELGYMLPGIAPTLYFKHPLDSKKPLASDSHSDGGEVVLEVAEGEKAV